MQNGLLSEFMTFRTSTMSPFLHNEQEELVNIVKDTDRVSDSVWDQKRWTAATIIRTHQRASHNLQYTVKKDGRWRCENSFEWVFDR